jgi:DNA-binding XRE family transcriptional regulator
VYLSPPKVSPARQAITYGGSASRERGRERIGLNRSAGDGLPATSSASPGATELPIPHRNTPSFAARSCSLRARMVSIGSPASVPKRVQQKVFGRISCISVIYHALIDCRADILSYLAAEGISHEELAKRAGVHQTTVSRIVKGSPKRQGPALRRLCKFMQEERRGSSPAADVEAIWDGTPEHADALRGLLRASDQLWRGSGKELR